MTFIPDTENPLTAFGELLVAQPSPVVQLQFPYNINTEIVEKRENNAGTITQADSMAVMQSGASANSAAHLLSRVPIRYNPGQGIDVRFTALFTTGVANSIQVAGLGEVGDGLFFGFNGATFSINRREKGVPEIQTVTITNGATLGPTGNITINLDSVAKTVAVANGDTAREVAVKIAAADFSDTGLGWSTSLKNATVIFKAWSDGNKAGTFSLVDTDATGVAGTFAETVAGVSTTNNWTAQSSWSEDVMDGTGSSDMTLDPTKINVYRIHFQYLGAGAISFEVENPATGRFVHVHEIEYANANILPSLVNPTLPLHVMAKNTSNTSNLTIKTSSMAGMVEGIISDTGLSKGKSNVKIGVGTSQTSVIAIRNNVVYQGKLNRIKTRIAGINFSSDGTKLVTVKVTKNPVLDGTPAFTDVDANTSVISIDTAGTTFTGGIDLGSLQLGKADSKRVTLGPGDLDLLPGDLVVISGATTSSTSDIGASVNWRELF